MSHPLQTKLNISLLTNDPNVIIKNLPMGWSGKFENIIRGLDKIIEVKLTGLDITNGVLYITFVTDDQTKQQLADYVTKTLLQQSARICMICGQHARRRKEQAHKPALCRTHYLEYINAIED